MFAAISGRPYVIYIINNIINIYTPYVCMCIYTNIQIPYIYVYIYIYTHTRIRVYI